MYGVFVYGEVVYITSYPIYIDGIEQGKMTVHREGIYSCFDGEMRKQSGLVRLYIAGEGKTAYLGIAENTGDKTILRRRFSDAELKKFPGKIEYCTNRPGMQSHRTAHEPKQDSVWVKHTDGTLTAQKDGKMLVAFPAKLRKSKKCIPTVQIDGREYVVFPR